MNTKLQTFLIILGLLTFATGGFFVGQLLFPKTIYVPQTVTTFVGVPDSVKVNTVYSKIIPVIHTSKPDTVKIISVVTVHDTLEYQVKRYESYKTFTDSLGNYEIKAIAYAPIDSLFMTIRHFAMKEVPLPDVWTYFKWGGILGATAVLVVEIIFHKWIFK